MNPVVQQLLRDVENMPYSSPDVDAIKDLTPIEQMLIAAAMTEQTLMRLSLTNSEADKNLVQMGLSAHRMTLEGLRAIASLSWNDRS